MADAIKVFAIPLEGVGIENNRTYYAQSSKPFLTINLEHTSQGLIQRSVKNSQHNRFVLGYASFREKSVNLFYNPTSNTIEYSVDKIFKTTSIQNTTFVTRPYLQPYRSLFFNQHYFFFHRPFSGDSILLRFNPATDTFATNPYTLPTSFENKYFAAGKYANRVWLSHASEPLLACSNVLAIQGNTTEFDLYGIGSNSPVVYIGSASFSQIGAFRTFLVFVQEDGTILVYEGFDPSSDFRLVFLFKLDGFIPKLTPVSIGSDIYVFSEYGCFSIASLLNSPSLDFLNLNIFKEAQPLYRFLIRHATNATYNFFDNTLRIFGTGSLDSQKPIFNIPNIAGSQYSNFNFAPDGIFVLSFNFQTGAVSYAQYEDIATHQATFDSQNLQLRLTFDILTQMDDSNKLTNYLFHYLYEVG